MGHAVRFLRGHGALGTEQMRELEEACGFPCRPKRWSDVCVPGGNFSSACQNLLLEAKQSVGDFYIYNFFDTCRTGFGHPHEKTTQQFGEALGRTYPCGTDEAV